MLKLSNGSEWVEETSLPLQPSPLDSRSDEKNASQRHSISCICSLGMLRIGLRLTKLLRGFYVAKLTHAAPCSPLGLACQQVAMVNNAHSMKRLIWEWNTNAHWKKLLRGQVFSKNGSHPQKYKVQYPAQSLMKAHALFLEPREDPRFEVRQRRSLVWSLLLTKYPEYLPTVMYALFHTHKLTIVHHRASGSQAG